MTSVIEYIYKLSFEQHELVRVLHNFFEDYGLKSSLKYTIPFYSKNKVICYINPQKPRGAEIVFWQAQQFKNLHLLDIKKRKSMAGITFETIDSIDFDVLNLLITEGIEIDDWMRK